MPIATQRTTALRSLPGIASRRGVACSHIGLGCELGSRLARGTASKHAHSDDAHTAMQRANTRSGS